MNLTKGALSVKYKDAGWINEPQMLAEFSADEKMPIGGAGGFVIIAHLGIGFVCCGVGILLFIGGYYAVKYFAIGCWKALTWVYARRK